MEGRIINFLKVYSIFMFFALVINLFLEISLRFILEIPEPLDVLGVVIFFSIFNFLGALVFSIKRYTPSRMGLLSLILGQFLEFTFMKPEWVLRMSAFEFSGETIAPFMITSIFYWFPAWAIPSYVIQKLSK
ncbi:MAG: hypothetical protein ACTSR0_06080 [Candidatus Asgardarchaeia archaeon]